MDPREPAERTVVEERSERALRSAEAEYVVLEAQVAAGGERDESAGALLFVG
jgi:hypothetical protein